MLAESLDTAAPLRLNRPAGPERESRLLSQAELGAAVAAPSLPSRRGREREREIARSREENSQSQPDLSTVSWKLESNEIVEYFIFATSPLTPTSAFADLGALVGPSSKGRPGRSEVDPLV